MAGSKVVHCDSCHYEGTYESYKPCMGYNDIRCPKCGSTNNAHNAEYLERVFNRSAKNPGTEPG